MKATKGLNNENKPGYFFTDITNINNFDPNLVIINETAVFNSGSTMYESVIIKNATYHTLFLITDLVFSGKVGK